jgi:hypothetical protein
MESTGDLKDLIPLKSVPQLLPLRRHGDRCAYMTVWRWVHKGTGPDRIRLATKCVGGNFYTTMAWLNDFVERVTASKRRGPAPATRTVAQREREKKKAKKVAATIGV